MQTDGNMVFSDMQFRDFGADNCYQIEKSQLYQKSLRSFGFKIVEFIVCYLPDESDGDKLIFVEAKTSLRSINNEREFNEEIADISQKFTDALQIMCGIWHGVRKDKMRLPTNFARFRKNGKNIVFLLVVKNLNAERIPKIEEAISRKLLKEKRLWGFRIRVYNEEFAIKKNFVLTAEEQAT
ncbi:MAG: hypothetical protein FWG68_05350 [Defluviitaleaceae bacterium]|nr:hypothetical protein [Defluviitaleaceae bacterium]